MGCGMYSLIEDATLGTEGGLFSLCVGEGDTAEDKVSWFLGGNIMMGWLIVVVVGVIEIGDNIWGVDFNESLLALA